MTEFTGNQSKVDDLLNKAKEIGKGKSLAEAGIELDWARTYGIIARRCRDDREFGLSPYPYEQGPGVGAFAGGYFEHREWPIRRAMERHNSMRPVFEYESNYINATGYWLAFHESASALREEKLVEKNVEEASRFDVWSTVAVRYALRVVGLRVEFYRVAARDPVYAKMIMPTLEQRYEVAAADDLTEAKEKLDSHLTTQLMKAVATLSASNATKRAGKGSAAGKQ